MNEEVEKIYENSRKKIKELYRSKIQQKELAKILDIGVCSINNKDKAITDWTLKELIILANELKFNKETCYKLLRGE